MGVEGGGEVLLDSQHLTHFSCEHRGESWVAIGDDVFREAEPGHEVFQILVGDTWPTDCLMAGDELCCLRAPLISVASS